MWWVPGDPLRVGARMTVEELAGVTHLNGNNCVVFSDYDDELWGFPLDDGRGDAALRPKHLRTIMCGATAAATGSATSPQPRRGVTPASRCGSPAAAWRGRCYSCGCRGHPDGIAPVHALAGASCETAAEGG